MISAAGYGNGTVEVDGMGEDVMERLRDVCKNTGKIESAMYIYKSKNNDLSGIGILEGDLLIYDTKQKPQPKDLTLFAFDNEVQPVIFLGYDFMRHPIICGKYTNRPTGISFKSKISLTYKAVAFVHDDEITYL